MRTSVDVESNRKRSPGAWIAFLRFWLRLFNMLLAMVGAAMAGYAIYMYVKFRDTHFSPTPAPAPNLSLEATAGFPWFIFAFGGAGVFTLLTALTGLSGVNSNSRCCLGLYFTMLLVLLLGQLALAIAYFSDRSWTKKLPHDDTGEAEKMKKFIESKLEICKWVGVGVLAMQVAAAGLACSLSAAQQRLMDDVSDEEDEVWGRRRPLISSPDRAELGEPSGPRTDPWSSRMREKYGLDTSQFGYNPEGGQQPVPPEQLPTADSRSRYCAIM
ncbi:hypothetical protein WJX72_008635 [[Myrmecia] bisecta]|uniref:Tetraspanin-19 n=1 Tax=[Myrmecia] bisecta TaxID=41462 RepID=A0AAW1PY12_9CHLO